MMTDETPIGYIEQRVAGNVGRRITDGAKCVMHDYLHAQNDHCLNMIKQTIKDEVNKRDDKFDLLESRLEQYMTKWAFGIIISICITLLGGLFGVGLWQISTLHQGQTDLLRAVVEIGVKQQGVLDYLKRIEPEHQKLMDHMNHE